MALMDQHAEPLWCMSFAGSAILQADATADLWARARQRDGDILIAPVSARNLTALRRPERVTCRNFLSDPRSHIGAGARRELDRDDAGHRKVDRATHDGGMPCHARSRRRSERALRDPAEALGDPGLADRGTFAPIADAAGEFKGVNAPWRMSGAHSAIGREIPSIDRTATTSSDACFGLSAGEIAKRRLRRVWKGCCAAAAE